MTDADIGLIGLAVMGENLVLNMANHGFTVAVYNRTTSRVDDFVNGRAAGKSVIGTHSFEQLCASLKRPRRVMIMVKAGAVVEGVIESLLPFLEPGDVIIDGGNSEFPDSTRRTDELAGKGILFVGTGVSGGEEGALTGPSIMPGGNPDAWPIVKPILQAIALGVFCTGIAYVLYYRLIANVGPASAVTVTYLVPGFAVLWGAIFIDESLTTNMVIGCTIILLGTALATGLLSFGKKSERQQIQRDS